MAKHDNKTVTTVSSVVAAADVGMFEVVNFGPETVYLRVDGVAAVADATSIPVSAGGSFVGNTGGSYEITAIVAAGTQVISVLEV